MSIGGFVRRNAYWAIDKILITVLSEDSMMT